MRILISNDDGVGAEGIRVLAEHLQQLGEVVVVAPDRQRSAAGHGITLHKPLYVEEMTIGQGVQAYAVSGTPADCVKFGVNEICKVQKPDLVVSGINAGSNLGNDVIYSGTVSAAVEGAIQGIPSIAVSLCGYRELNYEAAAKFMVKLAQQVTQQGLLPDTLLNVNVPEKADQIRGVKITSLGKRRYDNRYDKRLNPRQTPYYWLAGGLINLPNAPESDVLAIKEKYISVSPIHFDLTHYQLMDTLKTWALDTD